QLSQSGFARSRALHGRATFGHAERRRDRWTSAVRTVRSTTGGEESMALRVAIAALFLLGMCGASTWSARAESQADRAAWTPDVHEHCGEFIPDRDAIISCLKKKIRIISPACRRVMSRPYNPKNS